MDFNCLGLDAGSLAGSLETRLAALGDSGFRQAVLPAEDLASHPGGIEAAVSALRGSGVGVQALAALADFEGQTGASHAYKVGIAQGLLRLCRQTGARLLIVSASTAAGAGQDPEAVARDLSKLATLAVPLGIRIAYRAGAESPVAPTLAQAAELVNAVDRANLGLAVDSADLLASPGGLDDLDYCYPDQIFLVQLSDWIALGGGGGLQVFPGDGPQGSLLLELVARLRGMDYFGDFCLVARNGDYASLPAAVVAERAAAARLWLQRHLPNTTLPRRKHAARPAG